MNFSIQIRINKWRILKMTTFFLYALALSNAETRFRKVPEVIQERLEAERALLQEECAADIDAEVGDYAETYEYLKCLLAKKINQKSYVIDGYDNGNLCISYFLGMSEVLPVHPFYHCSECGYVELADDNVLSGYSLPNKACPSCGEHLKGYGLSIPLPEKIENLTYKNELGLKVSSDFLKKNHLDIARTLNLPRYRRGIAQFKITIGTSKIKFIKDTYAAILEYVCYHHSIDFKAIDYNDPLVYQTLFSENRFALGIVGRNIKQSLATFPEFNNTFDDWIRLFSWHSITFHEGKIPLEALDTNGKFNKYTLPVTHEEIAKRITELNIDFDLDYPISNEKTEEIGHDTKNYDNDKPTTALLVAYIRSIIFAPKKCAVFHKALTAYRMAYLRTYHYDILIEAIQSLGYQNVSKKEFRQVVVSYLKCMEPKDQPPLEYLLKHLPAAFAYFYDKTDPIFITKVQNSVKK